MFKDDLFNSGVVQHKALTISDKKTNSRRTSKTLVELSIGIIGIIGIMLAQIANNKSQHGLSIELGSQPTQNANVVYQLTNQNAKKVASMTEVSPMTIKVNLANILF